MKKIIAVISCLLLAFTCASAHSGRTDAAGGHWDSSAGEYHYHHGYPAHQHTGGICPYDYDDQTGANSGAPSSGSSGAVSVSGTFSSDPAPAPAETEPTEPEQIEQEYTYNNGLGDDGTYETAYNLGYQHSMEAANEYYADYAISIAEATTYLCHTKGLTGSTLYSDVGSSYDEAYEDGYLAAESDIDEYINILWPNGLPEANESTKSAEEKAVSLEYPYDRNDGTYETAYNIGYTKGCAELIELNSELLPDISRLTGELSENNRLTGSTTLEAKNATFESAFDDGYYQSETDFYAALNDLVGAGVSSDEADEIYDAAYNQGVSDTQNEYDYVSPVLCMLLLVVILTFVYYRNKANNTRS